jgi:hypothetical protein
MTLAAGAIAECATISRGFHDRDIGAASAVI